MQLTKFDRWLKEKFAIETHVQVLRLPDSLPRGVKIVELPDIPGKRFQYLLVIKNAKVAKHVFGLLRDESMMYNTQIITKDAWHVRFIAPEERSVTWTLISWVIIAVLMVGAAGVLIRLWQNPEIQKNIKEAIEILKG